MFTRIAFNILPIARKNISAENNPLRQMQAAIEAGYSLIIFPEGTRGSGDEMAPFKAGVAHLLERTPGLPVVPAYLVNMGRSLPKGEIIPVPFSARFASGLPALWKEASRRSSKRLRRRCGS